MFEYDFRPIDTPYLLHTVFCVFPVRKQNSKALRPYALNIN